MLIKHSFLNALATTVYVLLLSMIMSRLENVVDRVGEPFAPMVFLLLFILSAAVTGSLVVGRPIMMYMAGEKADAIRLFVYTLGWLLVAVGGIVLFASM
jgi:hypothetical protein